MRKIKLEEKHYQWGLTAFLVIVCCVLAFFAIHRFDAIQRFFAFAGDVLAPFIYGLVMAYLVCPIYNFTVRRTYAGLSQGRLQLKQDLAIAKGIGTVISILVYIVVIFGVAWMIIPGLVKSIGGIIDILPSSVNEMSKWLSAHLSRLPIDQETLDEWLDDSMEKTIKFATDIVLPHSKSLASSVSHSVIGAMGFLKNFIIGVIISVYFLNSKDTFLAQIKKVILAAFKEKTAEEIFHGAQYTNKAFGGFINGKIIDSFIIGIICFLCMTVFHWEYALLISCIIGLTNIIPFFGPFIGAVPSVLLLLMVNPPHALYFIIFILVLQQFDGNILGPKILGGSTGLDSFWVLFAVLVGGGLFGFIGMVIGIPVFAVIYYYAGRLLNRKLTDKGYSTDLQDYRVDSYRIAPEKMKHVIFGRLKRKKNKDSSAKATQAQEKEKDLKPGEDHSPAQTDPAKEAGKKTDGNKKD